MILIFDFFETLLNSKSIDFNRGLFDFWNRYYKDKCPFEEMKEYGEELFRELLLKHKEEEEYPFVKNELPLFAQRFGGDKTTMSASEEADFLMLCNEFELDPVIEEFVQKCSQNNIPMYVLSNSGFRAEALMEILNRFGIGKFFRKLWSSADFGRIKPCRDFFELAIQTALSENPSENREDIIYIGDLYETDVIGSYNAGIKSCWFNKKNGFDEKGIVAYNCPAPNLLFEIIDGN